MGLFSGVSDFFENAASQWDIFKEGVAEATTDFQKANKEFVSEMSDDIAELAGKTVDFVKENPGKTALIVGATVVTGGAAGAFATAAGPVIASALGSTGILGATASGTAISSLSGAALTNASLAAIGGGSLASGGAGVAGGLAVISTTGTVAGGAVAATGATYVATKES